MTLVRMFLETLFLLVELVTEILTMTLLLARVVMILLVGTF